MADEDGDPGSVFGHVQIMGGLSRFIRSQPISLIIGFPTVIIDKNVKVKIKVNADSLSLKACNKTTHYHLSELISISHKHQKK